MSKVKLQKALQCIDCRGGLERAEHSLICGTCGAIYPVLYDIADFSRGEYYDSFDPQADYLTPAHLRGLDLEVEGSIRRIRDFYAPLIRKVMPDASRVLDAGCGNGVSVDALREENFDAWGNDLSQLRYFQWRERKHRDRLVVASALRLPFPDEYFDVVVSSGVIEHIGVAETPAPNYSVRALENQRELRVAYLRELGRVLRPAGRIFLDFPHGNFPIDFWHGNEPGSPRLHSLLEPFLPSFREIKALAQLALGDPAVRARSPRARLQFKQAAGHLHGRMFRAPLAAFFRMMELPGLQWLAGTAANPFLVVEIAKHRFRPDRRSAS